MILPPTATCEYCQGSVIHATVSGAPKVFDAAPSQDGIYSFSEAAGDKVRARRLSTTAQFGRQGRLHRLHDCAQGRRWKRR